MLVEVYFAKRMYRRLLALSLLAIAAIPGGAIPQTLDRAAPLNFQGRYLLSASDADMLASAYVNRRLGPREGRDALSVIPLGGHIRDLQAYEVEASNSVAGPPIVLAATPDGRYAIAIETFAPRPQGNWENQTFADLQHGDRLQLFDLADPTQPALVQEMAIAERPDSVSINRDGSIVAVAFHPAGAGAQTPLALFPLNSGRLGEPIYPNVPTLPPGERLIHAEWHPAENVLALVNETAAEVSFVQAIQRGDRFELQPWGNAVQIEKAPYMARFNADGQYLIVNNLFWVEPLPDLKVRGFRLGV